MNCHFQTPFIKNIPVHEDIKLAVYQAKSYLCGSQHVLTYFEKNVEQVVRALELNFLECGLTDCGLKRCVSQIIL